MPPSSTFLLCAVLLGLLAVLSSSATATATATGSSTSPQHLVQQNDQDQEQRNLQRGIDFFQPDNDLCNNNPDMDGPEMLGECDTSKFPDCRGNSFICYNRKPSRDHFYSDTHQPKFHIQYDRVLCYPQSLVSCSSCTPGRFCRSEQRCILDEVDYPCEEWY